MLTVARFWPIHQISSESKLESQIPKIMIHIFLVPSQQHNTMFYVSGNFMGDGYNFLPPMKTTFESEAAKMRRICFLVQSGFDN